MIKINKEAIIELLGLYPQGSKGWYIGKCVFCDKDDHMGINFTIDEDNKVPCYRCFKCGRQGSIEIVLEKIGRTDLMKKDRMLIPKEIMKLKMSVSKKILDIQSSGIEMNIPLGFKWIDHHPYLESRGFTSEQCNIFNTGIALLDPRYGKDYVVFLVMEEGKCVGHLGRSILSNEVIDEYNKNRDKKSKIKRWKNSSSDFDKALFGIDEINENTHTVILVEGITTKAAVDRKMKLYKSDDMKCCATFGKRVSDYQICKLLKKGIVNIVLFFDADAVDEIKQYSAILMTYFNIGIAYNPIKKGNGKFKDGDDMTMEELNYTMSNMHSVLGFNMNVIHKKELHGKYL